MFQTFNYFTMSEQVNNLKLENAQLRNLQRGTDNSHSQTKPDKDGKAAGSKDTSREGSRCVSMYEDRPHSKPTHIWQPDVKEGDSEISENSETSDGDSSKAGKKPKPKPKVPVWLCLITLFQLPDYEFDIRDYYCLHYLEMWL